jgi:hypothetical protein
MQVLFARRLLAEPAWLGCSETFPDCRVFQIVRLIQSHAVRPPSSAPSRQARRNYSFLHKHTAPAPPPLPRAREEGELPTFRFSNPQIPKSSDPPNPQIPKSSDPQILRFFRSSDTQILKSSNSQILDPQIRRSSNPQISWASCARGCFCKS